MTLTKTEQDRLWDLISPIKVGMLVTWDQKMPRARPMQLVQNDFDGTLYFYTDKKDQKINEIERQPHLCVSFSDHDNNKHISISGLAVISANETLINKFWSPFIAAWFPEGKEQATLIKIEVQRAEIWDSTNSKMKILYEIAMANLTHKTPNLGENLKLG